MKIKVIKNESTILSRDDVESIKDKGGAYEVSYEDETGQIIYKDDKLKIEIN